MQTEQVYFDRYQRFAAAAALIGEFAAGRDRLSILDVGSHDLAVADFLPGHQVTAFTGLIGRTAGVAPYPDRAFDICLALDVLEHVPAGDRAFFLAELTRISGIGCVLCFPIPGAAQAEEFVLRLTGSAWLAEHRVHGLPDPRAVEETITALGWTFTRRPNASLASWTAMMLLMHGVDVPLRHEISAFFNRNFSQLENREPAYRYIYFLTRPA